MKKIITALSVALAIASCAENASEPIGRFHFNASSLAGNAVGGGLTQGMAIYDDFMFALRDSGSCLVFDLNQEKFLSDFRLGCFAPRNHANVAFFGASRYDESDVFPLLYVSQARAEVAPIEGFPALDSLKQLLYVERIITDSLGIPCRSELVQVIYFPIDHYNSHLWTCDRKHPEKIYCYGNTIGNEQPGNDVEVYTFNAPAFDRNNFVVTLGEEDARDRFLCSEVFPEDARAPQMTILQGGTVTDGKLILCTGAGSWKHPSEIFVIDMDKRDRQGHPARAWSFDTTSTMPYEFEDIDFWKDQLYCQTFENRRFTPVETIPLKDLGIQNHFKTGSK